MNRNEVLQTHASNILAHAQKAGSTTLKLLGGVAIRRLYPELADLPVLRRTCKDIDFAVGKRESKGLGSLFISSGFEADRHFNALHGDARLLYTAGELQADVFVGVFEQCHKISLERRLGLLKETLSPADLLLMKLQVVQMNEKDLQDLCVLFLGPELGVTDSPAVINVEYLIGVTSDDWGWHTTCSDSLKKLIDFVNERLPLPQRELLVSRIAELQNQMDAAPKSLKWRLRNVVGRRVQWYELPEEARR